MAHLPAGGSLRRWEGGFSDPHHPGRRAGPRSGGQRRQTLFKVCHPTDARRFRSAPAGKGLGMWLAFAFVFLIAWLIAFVAFHVAVAAIHVLLGLFVVFLIIHFIRRAGARA